MTVRSAAERDIPRILELLLQVCAVHHEGRPDPFRAGARKYDATALAAILADGERPVLVAFYEKLSLRPRQMELEEIL